MKTIRIEPLFHQGKSQIKIKFEYNPELNDLVKQIEGRHWSDTHKCWYVPNNPSSLKSIYRVFKGKAWIDSSRIFSKKSLTIEPNDKEKDGIVKTIPMICKPDKKFSFRKKVPEEYENLLKRRRYSPNTIKTYVSLFREFINYFSEKRVEDLTEEDIREYQDYLVTVRKISTSTQNQAINAIKFYFEKVLGGSRKVYYIERPRKEKKLPTVLSEEQISKIFNSINNLKHKSILALIYSAGLRSGELIGLRIQDLMKDKGLIFIRSGKGKKDRVSLLSNKMIPLIDQYKKEYQPRYWLFEGPKGKPYSKSSVRSIFKAALDKAKISGQYRLHDLRHSFATHLIEQGVNLRYVQELLGHSNPKTTEIYTHVSKKNLAEVRSPLDNIDL